MWHTIFYSRSLIEVLFNFGSMCPIALIGKNDVNRHSIIVHFSNKRWVVYPIKYFEKERAPKSFPLSIASLNYSIIIRRQC